MWRYPLGFGWTHPYNLYVDPEWPLGITVDSLGHIGGGGYTTKVDTVKFYDESGQSWLFKKASTDSIYQMPVGCNFQLRYVNNRWTLYREDGTLCKFNGNGRLDTLDGRNGNKMAFTYDSQRNLSNIKTPTGKNYYFKYSYASADSHRLWKLYETSDTTSGPYFEYKYRITAMDSGDTLIGNVSWRYQLTEVFHHTGGAQDKVELMHRYYYQQKSVNYTNNYQAIYKVSRLLTVAVRPDTGYGGADTSYANGINTGDRLQCWYGYYDNSGRVIYQEEVKGNGNTLVSQAFFEYNGYYPSSTNIYYYTGSTGGAAHSVTDTFTLSAPTSGYLKKTIQWGNGNKKGVKTSERDYDSSTGDTSQTNYLGYNSNFQADTVIGPRGDTTFYTFQDYTNPGQGTRYLSLPKVIKYANKDSVVTWYSSKAGNTQFFQPDSTKDENAYLRKFYYDTYGNDTVVVDTNRVLADSITSNPQTLRTRFGYTKGNRVRVTDPKGANTHFNFGTGDSAAYPTQTWIDMDNSGGNSPNTNDIVTQYWYNTSRGLLDSMDYFQHFTTVNPQPIKVRYAYDALNHLTKVTYPDSAVDSLVYDKRGNMLEKWMLKGSSNYWHTLYSYDAMDHLTQVQEQTNNLATLGPLSGGGGGTSYYKTGYTYNLNGDLAVYTNAHSNGAVYATTYSYSMGRLIRVGYSDGTHDSLGYYPDGSLQFKQDRKGQVIGYLYDNNCSPCGRGRLTGKWYYPDWKTYINDLPPSSYASDSVRYAYDKVGNLVKTVFNGPSALDSTLFAYDQLYRLQQDSSVGFNRIIRYQYDLSGNRQRMRVVNPSAGADSVKLYISYGYWDRANRDSTIAVKIGANSYTWQMFYYNTGPLKRIIYPTTTNTMYERYNLTSRNFIASVIDSLSGSPKFRNIYTYNQVGDRSSDSLLLTKPNASTVQGKIRWNYDNIRRLTATRYPASISSGDSAIYAYDEMGNRTSKTSGGSAATYTYNNAANQLLSNGGSYSYDNNGNLSEKDLPNQSQYYYSYDFENRLTKAKYTKLGSDSVTYEYDGLGQRKRKIGTSDTTRYTWDGLYPVVEWNNQGKLKQTFVYANGLLLGIVDSTVTTTTPKRYFVLHDGLGSSIALTDTTASIKRSLIFSDFGQSLVDTSASGIPALNRLYASYPWDGTPANFYWMKGRQTYDPTLGRFGQEDRIPGGFNSPIGLNRYLYVINNPVGFTDPTGLQAEECCSCEGMEIKKTYDKPNYQAVWPTSEGLYRIGYWFTVIAHVTGNSHACTPEQKIKGYLFIRGDKEPIRNDTGFSIDLAQEFKWTSNTIEWTDCPGVALYEKPMGGWIFNYDFEFKVTGKGPGHKDCFQKLHIYDAPWQYP